MTGMMRQFSGDTADAIWRDAAAALLADRDVIRQDSRLGVTRELLHTSFVLTDPRQRWILSRQPAINPAFAIAEIVWIFAGREDSAFLNFWNPALPRFAGVAPRYHGAYGHRLRRNLGFDQLNRAFGALSAKPESRQVVLQIWDGARDLPLANGQARDPDIPCNICAMPKIRNGRLEWMQVMRSNDLFLGTPHNFVQFTVIQEVMAGWLGIEPGSYVQVSDSLHFYEKDLKTVAVAEQPPELPEPESLALPKADSDEVMAWLNQAMDLLCGAMLTRHRFATLVTAPPIPRAWADLFCVVAADTALRRHWPEEAVACIADCTSPVLVTAWTAWRDRLAAQRLARAVP